MSDAFGSAIPGDDESREFSGASSAPQNGAFDDAAAKLSRGERRMRRRALISAPVRVRSVDVIDNIDEVSTTLDVSRGGVL